MGEEDKKRENLDRARAVMRRFDPALLSAALSEMLLEANEAEEVDVAKVKEAIKGIYDSIPEGKDRKSIVSKAITELDSDIIDREVKVIKENLASIDRETIVEAAKDYVDVQNICVFPIGGCKVCISSAICVSPVGGCKLCVSAICASPVGGCKLCISSAICALPIGGCKVCINYSICAICVSSAICAFPVGGCKVCISYSICNGGCPLFAIYECASIGIYTPPDSGIDPQIKVQLKEEIIQEILQRPELSRAVKKMLKKIQDEK